MKWLTKTQVKNAAKKGERTAIKCSIRHWTQIRDATNEELAQADDNDKVSNGAEFCALCKRYYNLNTNGNACEYCPLYKNGFGCLTKDNCSARGPYAKAQNAYYDKLWSDKSNRTKDFNIMINALTQCLK